MRSIAASNVPHLCCACACSVQDITQRQICPGHAVTMPALPPIPRGVEDAQDTLRPHPPFSVPNSSRPQGHPNQAAAAPAMSSIPCGLGGAPAGLYDHIHFAHVAVRAAPTKLQPHQLFPRPFFPQSLAESNTLWPCRGHIRPIPDPSRHSIRPSCAAAVPLPLLDLITRWHILCQQTHKPALPTASLRPAGKPTNLPAFLVPPGARHFRFCIFARCLHTPG